MEQTPKQKASEIYNNYYLSSLRITQRQAKHYSNICIDEIVKVLDKISKEESGTTKVDYGQSYWNEVKEEIKKL